MIKKTAPLFLFLFATLAVTSQTSPVSVPGSSADTVYKKILLIPYNPVMHLSDADPDIAEYSQQKATVVRAAFRNGLLQNLSAKLLGVCETQPMRYEGSKETQQDLDMIYGSINYEMDTVFPVSHPQKDTLPKKKSILSKSHSKLKEIHDLKYMNIRLSHPELLAHLSEKYGTDLFVFLNQFEIITHYDDCLDLALKIYRRQLKVHYSVFNVTGKQLYGDVAVVDFPSNSNDLAEIMQRNFPKISDYILTTIPRRK